MTDARLDHAATSDAEPPRFFEPCDSQAQIQPEFSSKFHHGGARVNSGGARENSGGARKGAGRPRKHPVEYTSRDMPHWYCLRTKFGRAFDADKALWDAGFTVFNPVIWLDAEAARRDGATVHPAKPTRVVQLFTGYMFVELNLHDPDWRMLRELPGVDRLLCRLAADPAAPSVPIHMPDQAIPLLRERCHANDCIYPDVPVQAETIPPGAQVRIAGGPYVERFFDAVAICRWSAAARVALLLRTLDGREFKLTVRREDVVTV